MHTHRQKLSVLVFLNGFQSPGMYELNPRMYKIGQAIFTVFEESQRRTERPVLCLSKFALSSGSLRRVNSYLFDSEGSLLLEQHLPRECDGVCFTRCEIT